MKLVNQFICLRHKYTVAVLFILLCIICSGCSKTVVMYSFETKGLHGESSVDEQNNCYAVTKVVCTDVDIPLMRSESLVNQCRAYFKVDAIISGSGDKIKKRFGVPFDCSPLCATYAEAFQEDRVYIFYFSDENTVRDIRESD